MKWQPIETAPRDGTRILIRYWKAGRNSRTSFTKLWIVTEAYYVPLTYSSWDTEKKHPTGRLWNDALGRLISDENSPKSKSTVAWWMPIPDAPDEE